MYASPKKKAKFFIVGAFFPHQLKHDNPNVPSSPTSNIQKHNTIKYNCQFGQNLREKNHKELLKFIKNG
jgi:hypothetical protein